jgi:NADH-quinone oxidoreductase subunit A
MLNPYLGVLFLIAAAACFLAAVLWLAGLLGPKHPTQTKQLPFECGGVSVGDVKTRSFDVQFYLVGMLFILFDVEVIFLYPWSVVFRSLGWFAFFEMLLFVLVMALGLVYVWRKGVLDWGRSGGAKSG